MTSVTSIEFCASEFKTEQQCYEWIKNSEYHDLDRIKGFHLRRNTQADFLTSEKKRPVFRYRNNLHCYTTLELKRHTPGVCVVLGTGHKFSQSEIPAALPSNILREQKKKEEHQKRILAARVAREAKKAAMGPPAEKPPRKRGGVKEATKKKTKTSKKRKELEDSLGIKMDPVDPPLKRTDSETL